MMRRFYDVNSDRTIVRGPSSAGLQQPREFAARHRQWKLRKPAGGDPAKFAVRVAQLSGRPFRSITMERNPKPRHAVANLRHGVPDRDRKPGVASDGIRQGSRRNASVRSPGKADEIPQAGPALAGGTLE